VASSTAMSAIAASSTAMSAVAASSTAMSAVAASSTAMSAVMASSTASGAVAGVISTYRLQLVSMLEDSNSGFSKQTTNIGNGSGTFENGGNTTSIYVPISCYDDGDTDYVVQSLLPSPGAYQVCSIPKHSGITNITTGVTLKGARVVGSGSSIGYVTFNVYYK